MFQKVFYMRVILVSFLLFLMGCASVKNQATEAELADLKEVMKTNKVDLTFNWARPIGLNAGVSGLQGLMPPGSTTSNISLIGNLNYLIIKKDSLIMDLPYYGQQQLPRGYNTTDTGVAFKGLPYKSETEFKDNKYILKYWLDAKYEDYRVIVTLFPNKKSTLNVNSSHRTTINYDGTWEILNEEENKEIKKSK